LGELLDRKHVRRPLGATLADVDAMVERRQLLGLPTKRGEPLFPAFQFTKDGNVHPAVPTILKVLADSVASPYTIASWFVSPQALLRSATPASWLQQGRDAERVIEAARRSAQRLGQ
jgi:hypothetical protein